MSKHTLGEYEIEDPYRLIMLSVLEDAFRTIKCYYSGKGTEEEIEAGKQALTWIRKMQWGFRLTAIAANKNLDEFHQMCLYKIGKIKEEVKKCRDKQ